MMNVKAKFAGRAALMLVAAAVMAAVVMWLWNAVLPGAVTGTLPIDYPHALGLLVLCRILFGGFRGHGGPGGWGARRRWARWDALTPEERERFMQRGWRGRGWGGGDGCPRGDRHDAAPEASRASE